MVSIPLVHRHKSELELSPTAAVILAPLSETLLPLHIPRTYMHQDCLIEPIPGKFRLDIAVAKLVVRPTSQQTICRVLNASKTTKRIKRGEHIAQISLTNVLSELPPALSISVKPNLNTLRDRWIL